METFQTKGVETIKTHILCSISPSAENRSVFLNNVEKYGTARQATGGNRIQHKRFEGYITKAIDTHSEYVILIAFPQKQWLLDSISMLGYTYTVCLAKP